MRWLVDARPLMDPAAGGVPRVARRLIEAFIHAAKDSEIVLATTGRDPAPGFQLPASPNARHTHINIPNKIWSAACTLGLTSLDREIAKRTGKINTVFLPNIGFTGPLGTPYVLLLHDLSFLIEPRWFSRRMRLWHRSVRATSLIQNASHLLAVSEQTKHDAFRLLGIPEDRISVIPLGPTLSVPATSYTPQATSSPYVLAFDGGPRKNVATAVETVRALRQDPTYAEVELILVGSSVIPPMSTGGTPRWIPRSSRRMTQSSWIHIIPSPADAELAALYQHAAAFLYPSWYEGYGLPLHEAATFGTPCIASTAGALPETAPRGTLFADPAKLHHWTEALRNALSSPRTQPVERDPSAWNEAAKILKQLA